MWISTKLQPNICCFSKLRIRKKSFMLIQLFGSKKYYKNITTKNIIEWKIY